MRFNRIVDYCKVLTLTATLWRRLDRSYREALERENSDYTAAGIERLVPNYLANIRRDIAAILAGVDANDCDPTRRLGTPVQGFG